MKKHIMKSVSTFLVLLVFLYMMVGCGKTAVNPAAALPVILDRDSISKDNIMKTVTEFASPKYRGRMAGTEETMEAAQYIASNFKSIGLNNPEGLENYMQFFQIPLVELTSKPVLQIMDKSGKAESDFAYAEDFVLRRVSSEKDITDITASMYLVKDPLEILERNEKLKDKILLIPWKYYSMIGSQEEPSDYAKLCGALGVISEFDISKSNPQISYLKVTPLTGSWILSDYYKPFVTAESDTFAKLTKAAAEGKKVHLGCTSKTGVSSNVSNVVGIIPGIDPKLKDQYIVIGAHYDHAGDNANGTYNPGTLDNASGVAAMMELARTIKDSGLQPKKTIVFIAFSGESSGFWGSSYYCQYPIYPLKKSVMINMDMVGSAVKIPLSISLAIPGSNSSVQDAMAQYAEDLSIAYVKDIESASDHVSFEVSEVPSVCLSNKDFASGYHSSHETIEVVDGNRIKEITGLVLYYVQKTAY